MTAMGKSKLHIVTAPGFGSFVPLMESVARGVLPDGAVCIYPGRRNQLYRFPTPEGDMVVKCFRRPGPVNSFVYGHLRKGKACRSYLNSLRLSRMGIGVPQPVAYAEIRSGARLGRSFYLCRAVEGDTIRFYESRPDCDEMLHALAREMLRLHLLGVWHKDFSPGNVIVRRESDGSYAFNYVDLNRMRFDVGDHGRQLRNFERINYTEMHTLRLARAYARLLPAPADTFRFPQLLDPQGHADPLQGLYPLLRSDALVRKGEEYIETRVRRLFRRFWHSRARKRHLKRLFK